MADVYMIKNPRRAGGVISSAVNCGYSPEQLASLRAHGYKLFKNGKKIGRENKNDKTI